MPFTALIPVRFGDVDPAGFVYYANIYHYFHVAMEEYFAARCGITYADLIEVERLGFPTVKVETEFFEPLHYGDVAQVEVKITGVGDSSATFEYQIKRSGEDVLCARSKQIQVCMSFETKRGVNVPDKYRAAFLLKDGTEGE